MAPTPLQKAKELEAFRVRAIRDFVDESKVSRSAGDVWHIYGPVMYRPRVEVAVVRVDKACSYEQNTNLIMRSGNDHVGQSGTFRKAGEMYVIVNPHFYLVDVNESIFKVNTPMILSALNAIKLTASINLKDVYGKTRKAGDIWLVNREMAAWHTLTLHEELV